VQGKEARIKSPIVRAGLFVFALIIGSLVFAYVAAYVLYQVFGNEFQQVFEQANNIQYFVVLYLFQFAIYVALIIFFCRFIDQRPLYTLGLIQADMGKMFLRGMLIGFALLLLAFVIIYLLDGVLIKDIEFPLLKLFWYVLLFMMVAVGEEWVFRGYLFTNLSERLGEKQVVLITSILFTLVHLGNQHIASVAVLNIFLAGLLLGVLRLYRGGMWLAIGLHFGWNFVQGPVLGFAVSGITVRGILQTETQGAAWLSGGNFGLEGSVLASVLMIAALYILNPWKLQQKGDQDEGMGAA
jgi:membrane protease YdiL (CAAX protease family)